ncbi:HAMP domain-containing sensor histidine kinase [Mycoplasmatota bacterium zrk1]
MRKFRNLSLSNQIFFLITSFILLLIVLQFLIYRVLFQGFYMNTQLSEIELELESFVEKISIINDNDYFDDMYTFAANKNSISLIVDNNYDLVTSEYSVNSVEVTNMSTAERFNIILDDILTSIKLRDTIVAKVSEIPDSEDWNVSSLKVNNDSKFDYPCDNCKEIRGTATEIHSPDNLNPMFMYNQVARGELSQIKSLDQSEIITHIETGEPWVSETEFSTNYIYIHKINDHHILLTIYVMQSSESVLNILSTYNFSIYAVMIALAIIISVIVSNMISKPIISIDDAAKEISELNFDINANENQNKETSSLSNSINTIAVNLKENIDQLNNRNKEVLELYEKQTKQVTLRRNFISAISHELKTPLMVMNITVQGILDGIFSINEQEEELHKVLAEITNLDVMIKDLLDIFKLDEMDIKDDLDKINLKTLAQKTLDSVINLTNQYRQEVSLDTVRSPVIYGDKKLLSMVVSNIITNAIKYTPAGEKIDISIRENRNTITFMVNNYGVNIPEDSLEHLFEPFYRVDESRTKSSSKTKGTGLGLYIVSETLKAHNFDFGIENIENGVSMWFTAKKFKK